MRGQISNLAAFFKKKNATSELSSVLGLVFWDIPLDSGLCVPTARFLPMAPPFLAWIEKLRHYFAFPGFLGGRVGPISLWLIADFLLAQGYDTFCHISFLASCSSLQKSSLYSVFSMMWRIRGLTSPPRTSFLGTGDLPVWLDLLYNLVGANPLSQKRE